MAKLSGLSLSGFTIQDAALVARDLTNDILDFTFDMPSATFDVTGVDKSTYERLPALGDAKLTLTTAFNPATSHAHAVFSGDRTIPRVAVVPFPAGGGSGATATFTALITDYNLTRAANGGLTAKVTLDLSGGSVAWT